MSVNGLLKFRREIPPVIYICVFKLTIYTYPHLIFLKQEVEWHDLISTYLRLLIIIFPKAHVKKK